MKAVDVTTEITINAPVAMVSGYAANPINAPEWYINIHSAEWIGAASMAVGSRAAFKAKFLGKQLAYVYEIAEYEPGSKLVMRTADGPFPMETTYIWQDAGEGMTRMTLRNTGMPKGFSRVFAPIMEMAMRKANMNDLRLLKKILEK